MILKLLGFKTYYTVEQIIKYAEDPGKWILRRHNGFVSSDYQRYIGQQVKENEFNTNEYWWIPVEFDTQEAALEALKLHIIKTGLQIAAGRRFDRRLKQLKKIRVPPWPK